MAVLMAIAFQSRTTSALAADPSDRTTSMAIARHVAVRLALPGGVENTVWVAFSFFILLPPDKPLSTLAGGPRTVGLRTNSATIRRYWSIEDVSRLGQVLVK